MKKTWIVILALAALIIVMAIFCILNSDYTPGSVQIKKIGTIWLPEGWVYEETDGIIRVTDTANKDHIYLIGSIGQISAFSALYPEDEHEIYPRELLYSEVFSNSAMISEIEFAIDGETVKKRSLCLTTGTKEDVTFIVWDDNVSWDVLRKIADSHIRFEK